MASREPNDFEFRPMRIDFNDEIFQIYFVLRCLIFVMSAAGGTVDKPLELIQKTYQFQSTTNNPGEQIVLSRSSTAKVPHHHPSRKTSVHDVHEATREDFNKVNFRFVFCF